MASAKEPKSVVLRDPLAIRALAHPARMTMIEVLYDSGAPMTATQLGEVVGLSPSAASYHLRSLERFGVIRRSDEPGDGRERPWVRAAVHLSVSPTGGANSRAGAAATGALVSTAMERDLTGLLDAQMRRSANDVTVPLDVVARYLRHSLVLTVKEAERLLRDVDALMKPYLEENRPKPPRSVGRLNVSMSAVPDPRRPGGHARTP